MTLGWRASDRINGMEPENGLGPYFAAILLLCNVIFVLNILSDGS